MIVRGAKGEIGLACDACPDGIETEETDFLKALDAAKAEGWKVRRIGGEWAHLCPACAGIAVASPAAGRLV